MSAIVCGKRSNIFEDLPTTPPVSKRIRCSSSPVRYSPPRTPSASPNPFSQSPLLDHLRACFPTMDKQLLERALEECGNDLDLAIRSLNELCLGSSDQSLECVSKSDGVLEPNPELQSEGVAAGNAEAAVPENSTDPKSCPMGGAEWVELFVQEMMSAANIDDAKARASRALEVLERSIYARASAEAAQGFEQENMTLKEQVEALVQENAILKRAVSIQHERQKEYENRHQELQQLKQLLSQYQEQLRTLEVNNYALTMHLKQAQQSSSIPGRFHPDVF